MGTHAVDQGPHKERKEGFRHAARSPHEEEKGKDMLPQAREDCRALPCPLLRELAENEFPWIRVLGGEAV